MNATEHPNKLIAALPSGHRLFGRSSDNRVAIADESGALPHITDDGVLWLDPSRPLATIYVPVVDPSGSEFTVPVGFPTILMLSAKYDWPIKANNRIYNVVQGS